VIFLCVIGRALHIIFTVGLTTNVRRRRRFGLPPISGKHMFVLWFAGLRGAIAYGLVIEFPSHNAPQLTAVTIWVIMFTIFVLGGATETLLKFLKIKMQDHDQHSRDMVTEEQLDGTSHLPGDTKAVIRKSTLFKGIQDFDSKFIKPVLRADTKHSHVEHHLKAEDGSELFKGEQVRLRRVALLHILLFC